MPATTVRSALVSALEADLVGPFDIENAARSTEELTLAPSRWYLTGFLAPKSDRETKDPTAEEDFGTGTDEEDENEPVPEPEPKQNNSFPASLGLSVLLPPRPECGDVVRATVSFAEYVREDRDGGEKRKVAVWRRIPPTPRSVELALESEVVEKGVSLPDTPGIRVCGKLEDAGLGDGTRALALFAVNERTPGEGGRKDEQFIFQVRLEVAYEGGFVSRPNRQGEDSKEPDDETADLQFRDHHEWAVGHGVAVEIPPHAEKLTRVATTWIPRSEVRKRRRDDGRRLRDCALHRDGGHRSARAAARKVRALAGLRLPRRSRPRDLPRRARAHERLDRDAARRLQGSAALRRGVDLRRAPS